jgi:hypothetical protein
MLYGKAKRDAAAERVAHDVGPPDSESLEDERHVVA